MTWPDLIWNFIKWSMIITVCGYILLLLIALLPGDKK